MTLSDLSIKNPVFAWMLMIGLIVFGWIGFSSMGISQMPDVDYPVVAVSATLEGAVQSGLRCAALLPRPAAHA